jgi:hypothetical protein
VAEPNVPFFATVLPGKYLYYTLNLTKVGTDVTVSTTKFFGTVDLFLSARQVPTLLALLVLTCFTTTKFFGTASTSSSPRRQVLTLLASLLQSLLAFLVQKWKELALIAATCCANFFRLHVQPLAQRYFLLSV